ncbi:FkbM family methyltransferase [Luteimonas vadosa]|uniref:Methyltransferase FkbM domain-containing protein n=1 Tax=Luteimonas vadosa TaxID=1165507 RepID=A0ABP9DMH5_9GAMM
MDIKRIAEEAISSVQAASPAVRAFQASHAARYAIGRNTDTLNVHRAWPLAGVIDDFLSEPTWQGIPIVRTRDIRPDAWIVNCSTSISPVAVQRHLSGAGLQNVLGLHELSACPSGNVPWPSFVQDQRDEIALHGQAWSEIYATLEDARSRQVLLDVLRYRVTADPAYMQGYDVAIQEQYFEEFMDYREETFIDAGGFDGDTAQAFADRYPDYRKIIVFEPSEKNMQSATRRLASYRDIEFRTTGLSDTPGALPFDPDTGSASSVTASGSSMIIVETLDAAVTEPVSVIKMDLEGWELKALHGSRSHITREKPKLAIAVYHAAPDLRLIHRYVQGFGLGYKCYLRHYTQGWSETVMYFVR